MRPIQLPEKTRVLRTIMSMLPDISYTFIFGENLDLFVDRPVLCLVPFKYVQPICLSECLRRIFQLSSDIFSVFHRPFSSQT